MALDSIKHQRGGMRPNAGRKIKYPWGWLLSVQKEINVLRKKRPGTTIKKALSRAAEWTCSATSSAGSSRRALSADNAGQLSAPFALHNE
jgi:uncharacterized protein YfiM (DUF2279 family)